MNSSLYHQIAKSNVADRLLAAGHARTVRGTRPPRQRSLPAGPRGAIVTRRVRALAWLRVAQPAGKRD